MFTQRPEFKTPSTPAESPSSTSLSSSSSSSTSSNLSERQKKALYAYFDAYTKQYMSKEKSSTTEFFSATRRKIRSVNTVNKFTLAKDPIKLKSDDCDHYKLRIREAKDAADYRKILIDARNDARQAREDGLTSVYAMCLYGFASRLIYEIQSDKRSELFLQSNEHIKKLKAKLEKLSESINYADTIDGNNPDPQDEKEYAETLVELALLGDGESIIKANQKLLLGVMPSLNPLASNSLLTDPSNYFTPVQPHYKRPVDEKSERPKPQPVKLKIPMEFQPNLYCWLPHYLATDTYPKSTDFAALVDTYHIDGKGDALLFMRAGIYTEDLPVTSTPRPTTGMTTTNILSVVSETKPGDTPRSTPSPSTETKLHVPPTITMSPRAQAHLASALASDVEDSVTPAPSVTRLIT